MTSLKTIAAFLFLSLQSNAMVDMRNANYSSTWFDLELPSSGYELKVSRTYNSRSLYNGIFGFGWCSDFETKIDVTPEGNLKLTQCGSGQETFYFPREFNKAEIQKTVGKILASMRSRRSDDKLIKELEKDLPWNHNLRAKYAYDLKISVPVREGTIFYANGKEIERIRFEKNLYIKTLADGSSQRFSKEGKLLAVYDKNGNWLQFDYAKDNLLILVKDNNGRSLNFKYYNNRKVRSISGPNNLLVEYKYENLDDLTYVKASQGNIYSYAYDDQHNLIKATWPSPEGKGTLNLSISYDKKKDWVTSFTDKDGCVEKYTYEDSPTDPKNNYWSTVVKTCGKEIVNESRYEFWHKTRSDGNNYLYRVSSVVNNNATEITYHEEFGKPISIRRNGQLFSYEYLPNGQVKSKSSKISKFTYEYSNENNKVSKVTAVALNEKGAVIKKITTDFRYDKKGNLVWARNSTGQTVEMTYDQRGRIATIKDQAKKFVKIQYDEKSGRPGIVERPGQGKINVTYKPNGEIDKVNSNEGPTVAMQVASTFNNLLEIISPATAEIYN